MLESLKTRVAHLLARSFAGKAEGSEGFGHSCLLVFFSVASVFSVVKIDWKIRMIHHGGHRVHGERKVDIALRSISSHA